MSYWKKMKNILFVLGVLLLTVTVLFPFEIGIGYGTVAGGKILQNEVYRVNDTWGIGFLKTITPYKTPGRYYIGPTKFKVGDQIEITNFVVEFLFGGKVFEIERIKILPKVENYVPNPAHRNARGFSLFAIS